MLKKTLILCFTLATLAGCSTPYQKSGLGGGYTDMALNENTYLVSFRGNGLTTAGTVRKYLLRRSAELTLQKGYDYFIILHDNTSVSRQLAQTPTIVQSQSYGNAQAFGYGNTNYFNHHSSSALSMSGYENSSTASTINPGTQYEIRKYTSSATIQMLKDNKTYQQALNAKIILENFQNK